MGKRAGLTVVLFKLADPIKEATNFYQCSGPVMTYQQLLIECGLLWYEVFIDSILIFINLQRDGATINHETIIRFTHFVNEVFTTVNDLKSGLVTLACKFYNV